MDMLMGVRLIRSEASRVQRAYARAMSEPAAGPTQANARADALVESVRTGYTFDGPALELGALMVDATQVAEVQVRIPLGMLNRHGLVAGATGTGKTVTLQLLAEQLSSQGVPVFAADIKGDLSGIATAGTGSDKLLARTQAIGQDWKATPFPVEFFALGGQGTG